MDWIIVVLVCLGLAFDVFSIAVSQGSVLGKVKFRGLVFMCLIVWAWQLVTLSIGYGIPLGFLSQTEVHGIAVRL